MKIQRIIFVFKKGEEKLVKEIDADILEFDLIKKLLTPIDDDPLIYRPYQLEDYHYSAFIDKIPELKNYPLTAFDLYLEGVVV